MNRLGPDEIIGGTAITIGGSGLTLQYLTQFASLTAAIINIALAFGGGYLLYLKLKKAKRDLSK